MTDRNNERKRAQLLSAAVDELIRDPEAQLQRLDPADADALQAARRLARLPALLGPADPTLEQRIVHRIRAGSAESPPRHRLRLRLAWAIVALAAILVIATLLTPFRQFAVASFMAVFRLGHTEVRITPMGSAAPQATALMRATGISHSLSLTEAQQQVPFPLLQPAYLPPGYALEGVTGYVYPDLPAWVPQPFSVELTYADVQGHEFSLREYPISLGEKDQLNTSALNLETAAFQDVREVDVNGRPAVLLRLGTGRGRVDWQELVWEQGNVIVSLLCTADLGEEALLRIARSVQ